MARLVPPADPRCAPAITALRPAVSSPDPCDADDDAGRDRTPSAATQRSERPPDREPRRPPDAAPRRARALPEYRLVGYAGLTGAKTLGRLGTGPLDQRVRELERRASPYANGREILPVLEVIATVVQGSPGRDGKYRFRISDQQIATYLKAARKRKALLLLNIQPGRSEFLPEAKAYEKWLREPDVGVALDPEWAMDKVSGPAARTGTPPAPNSTGPPRTSPGWSSATTCRRR